MFSRIRNTSSKLYNSVVLLVLPELETVLTGIARLLAFLEVREAALERKVEAHITAIVEAGKAHQHAIRAINEHYAKVNSANLSAVAKARDEATAAIEARTAVQNLLNNRG